MIFFKPGTDVMILKIFSPQNSPKKMAFFAETTAIFCKKNYYNIGFGGNRQLFCPKPML
jgi:hypothetical protein